MLGSQDKAVLLSSDICKQIVLILSRLSDSVQGIGEVHIFKHRLYISALEQARVLILESLRQRIVNIIVFYEF